MTKINIAFAENHIAVLETISSFLEASDKVNVIIKAENGNHLIQKLNQSNQLPDICLIDIKMPELNGFETVVSIKNKWPAIKIIVLTGYISKEFMERMILSGVNCYLSKSIHPTELIQAIESVSKKGIYYNQHFTSQIEHIVKRKSYSEVRLTEMEKRLMILIAKDYTYSKIAQILNVTEKCIEAHRSRLFQKINVNSKVSMVFYAINNGYIEANN